MKYYLAIDIGASSGRHILSHMENGKMILEEIYRFENGVHEQDGSLCWDMKNLSEQVLEGMKVCRKIGKIPVSVGIDTWGVDFVLLDENDRIIGNTVSYRDSRTEGMDEEVYRLISEKELYARTGIQKAIFNTVYQLMSLRKNHPDQLEKAKTFLFVPEYLTYLLSGVKASEYTIATTGQLIDIQSKDWDRSLFERLGFPTEMLCPLCKPGTIIGSLTDQVRETVGYDCRVAFPPMHDTASAVAAVPVTSEHCLYLSSGTWSLLGTESKEAVCTPESMEANFTNEGGYEYRYRILKNIMGLWMIQSVRREWGCAYTFPQISEMAEKADIDSVVDCQKNCFLAPKSMIEAVREECRVTHQQVPETSGEIAAVIYRSLAVCYAKAVESLEKITGVSYDALHIVGGGCRDAYLDRLTAAQLKMPVIAGPVEATAIGNVSVQMIADGVFSDLTDARHCIAQSFDLKHYPYPV